MKKLLFLLFFGIWSGQFYAQDFTLSAELKPRFEYRHGFKSLIPDNVEAGSFISQRSRLNFNYNSEKLNVYLILQNVRVWGDVPTLSATDVNGTAIHEAWASLLMSKKVSLKMGRQEIVYDDHRIFGNVDWAQTARSHDALIATYLPNENNRLDIGFALNEGSEILFETDYTINNYKAFQYAWYHLKFKEGSLSLLALNTGFAYDVDDKQEVVYNQTLGTHLTLKEGKFMADASAYFQTGKIANDKLSAFNLAGYVQYNLSLSFNLELGAEYLSGTDMNITDNKLNSFNPLFGTNHKFNGWMDYFYVGNHINSVGLLDINLPLSYKKDKLSVSLIPHLFSSAATVINDFGSEMNNYLGTEIDVTLGYKISENINFQIGYSQMFATETMEVLKGGNSDNTNNWAWAMFTIKPQLFFYKKTSD